MRIIKKKKELFKIVNKNEISFIPTMGSLHKGHAYLIKKAKLKNTKIIVSIFVNPKQFNSKKDFLSYPRNFLGDVKFLKKLNIDYLYNPNIKDIFSFKIKNKFFKNHFSKKLCGKFRPGHFNGVLNIVNRFLEILKPKYIYLGEKDFQQMKLIKDHIIQNKINTTVIQCKTVRYKNSIPYSSRNLNLNKDNIHKACKIFNLIKKEKKNIKKNRVKKINLNNLKNKIIKYGVKKIDYLESINVENFKNAKKYDENFKIFSAFYIDNVRLIDNF
tara:strand:- start:2073 stop:2888 length:816 start_codon:yes stop_codon:yes gene_type:complete